MNAVHVKNLTVAYDRRIVLNNISFEVPKGSLTAVIGPNGSGKSTLIKALLDLIPYQGRIKIFNQKPSLALNRIGYSVNREPADPYIISPSAKNRQWILSVSGKQHYFNKLYDLVLSLIHI